MTVPRNAHPSAVGILFQQYFRGDVKIWLSVCRRQFGKYQARALVIHTPEKVIGINDGLESLAAGQRL